MSAFGVQSQRVKVFFLVSQFCIIKGESLFRRVRETTDRSCNRVTLQILDMTRVFSPAIILFAYT